MQLRPTGLVCAGLWALAGCSDHYGATLEVVDERGVPLPDALAEVWTTQGAERHTADRNGRISLRRLDRPVLAVVSAQGHLAEPVPVGWGDAGTRVPVSLWAREGPAGQRVALHFGGDLMLGRRYEAPTTGSPLITPGDGGASASAVVSDLAPAFSLADASVVNLETVVGTLDDGAAYPSKRWLLQTHPESLAALDSLGVDLAVLANNHQRDWLDDGQASTLDALDDAGMPWVGGGMDAEEAAEPVILTPLGEGGPSVAVVAWTSVDGAYVNDQYPLDGDAAPDPLDPDQAWLYEARSWGVPEVGIAVQDRRIGSAWAELQDAEDGLEDADIAALWSSAEAVYPELQDWVAGRGHGGANPWDGDAAVAQVQALADEHDLVIAQLHMGYQFAGAPSQTAVDAARALADAGAGLVIGHHPHVLQGVEWHGDALICWSLGNFVFDQDFLATFDSAWLRTVHDADGALVEARLVPLSLDAYRPVVPTDGLATSALGLVWARSVGEVLAERGEDRLVRAVAADGQVGGGAAGMVLEHHTARLTAELPVATEVTVEGAAGEVVGLGGSGLVARDLGGAAPAGTLVGRTIFRLGSFDDLDTDLETDDVAGWTWEHDDVALTDRAAFDGRRSLQLVRGPDAETHVFARTVARIPFAAHRVYADADGTQPLDGDLERLSVRLSGWISGESDRGQVRLILYHFDDSDPAAEPTSIALAQAELPLGLDGRRWSTVDLAVPEDALAPVDGLTPNAMLIYVDLLPPETSTTVLRVDGVEVVEWRSADTQPAGWDLVDHVWLADDGAGTRQTLEIPVLPW